MITKIKAPKILFWQLICCFCLLLFLVSLLNIASAAPITYSSNTTISLTSPAISLTVNSGSVADLVVINTGNIIVNMSFSTGGSFVFTSPQAITANGSGASDTRTCSAGV